MPYALTDLSDRLYGRASDLGTLKAHLETPGITVVMGGAKQGKTWTLRQLAHDLDTGGADAIGFADKISSTPDLLLRAVQDLYGRLLITATVQDNLRLSVKNGGGWISEAVAAVMKPVVTAINGGTPVTETIIDTGFRAFRDANAARGEPGQFLTPLPSDQALALIQTVIDLTKSTTLPAGKRVVLILDQYHGSPDPTADVRPLLNLFQDADQCPPCHIIMASRPHFDAAQAAASIVAETNGLAGVHRLPLMNLDEADDKTRLLAELRGRFPALGSADDETVLGIVQTHPGILARLRTMPSGEELSDLRKAARDARESAYPEVAGLWEDLNERQRALAARFTLYPDAQDPGTWEAIRDAILAGLPGSVIDDLVQNGWLEQGAPPSMGHATRQEYARDWLLDNAHNTVAEQVEATVAQLAGQISDVTPATEPFSRALVGLVPVMERPGLCRSLVVPACVQAALALFGVRVAAGGALDVVVQRAAEAPPSWAAPLMARGLFNTLEYAKAENDLSRRDALLDELRALAAAHPADATGRGMLAKGLFNTLNHAKAEGDLPRRDALLQDLRALADAHPADAVVREPLAKGLFNTLNDAKGEGDVPRRDGLLDELRALAAAHPADATGRGMLAKGLVNTLNHAKAEDDLSRRDTLLDELRALAAAHPADAAVREQLAMGLVNTLNHAKAEDDLSRRDTLLYELRVLAATYRDDAAVQEGLARGLAGRLLHAREDSEPTAIQEALVTELTPLLPHISEGLRALIRDHVGL